MDRVAGMGANKLQSRLLLPLLITSLTILLSFNSCSSKPQLLETPKVTFDEDLRSQFNFYIGTLEGCVVGKKGKPIEEMSISADLVDFVNISAQGTHTDDQGCYSINLFWKQKPYLLVDAYPSPAQNSFTASGINYLKSARTVSLDIPIVVGKGKQDLTLQPVRMYSISYILKQIAEQVVLPRLRLVNFGVEDYNTGFPVVGADVTITLASSILSVDSLLAAYISQPNLREVAAESVPSFTIDTDTQVQDPKGSPEFTVMNYADYRLTVSHPDYHSVEEVFYIEDGLDKIVRVTPKDQERRVDIIDR